MWWAHDNVSPRSKPDPRNCEPVIRHDYNFWCTFSMRQIKVHFLASRAQHSSPRCATREAKLGHFPSFSSSHKAISPLRSDFSFLANGCRRASSIFFAHPRTENFSPAQVEASFHVNKQQFFIVSGCCNDGAFNWVIRRLFRCECRERIYVISRK